MLRINASGFNVISILLFLFVFSESSLGSSRLLLIRMINVHNGIYTWPTPGPPGPWILRIQRLVCYQLDRYLVLRRLVYYGPFTLH